MSQHPNARDPVSDRAQPRGPEWPDITRAPDRRGRDEQTRQKPLLHQLVAYMATPLSRIMHRSHALYQDPEPMPQRHRTLDQTLLCSCPDFESDNTCEHIEAIELLTTDPVWITTARGIKIWPPA